MFQIHVDGSNQGNETRIVTVPDPKVEKPEPEEEQEEAKKKPEAVQ